MRTRLPFLAAIVAASAVASLAPRAAHAEVDDGVSLRPHFEVSAAHFVSAFDAWQGREIGFGAVTAAALELGVSKRFGLEARLIGAQFAAGSDSSDPAIKSTGASGFFGGGVGFRTHPFSLLSGAWLGGAFDIVRTGGASRMELDLRVGWDFRAGDHTELGPFLGYLQVIEPDTVGLRPADARAVMIGLHLGFDEGPTWHRPPPPPSDVAKKPAPKPVVAVAPPPPPPPPHVVCPDGSDMEDGVCPAPDAPVKVVGDEIILGDRVYFDFGLANVKAKSWPLLAKLAKLIVAHPEFTRIHVQGHTDEIGTDEWNQKLSEARAAEVVRVLVKLGVPASRLDAEGFGKKVPRVEGSSETAHQLNRRVEFLIEKKVENVEKTETIETVGKIGKAEGKS
jgi:outer membrane protein OmpA-like peptidoglycan-associated protein